MLSVWSDSCHNLNVIIKCFLRNMLLEIKELIDKRVNSYEKPTKIALQKQNLFENWVWERNWKNNLVNEWFV